MDLILWRHAEAEDPRPGLPDEHRRLTRKGEKQARKMAKWLKKRLPKNTRILVSPTERTRMTARTLEMPYEIDERLGPKASIDDLIAATDWPAGERTMLLVGHQPTIGRVASFILANAKRDWATRKGAILWLSNKSEPAVLIAAITPALI